MVPGIAFTRKWADDDIARLVIRVSDGISLFVNEAYVPLEWGACAAADLQTFSRHIHGGLFNLHVGEGGPEYAGGAFHARFHYSAPHALMISTWQQGDYFPFKGREVAAKAKMYLQTEPALLDRFVAALPTLDASESGQVLLECIAVG